MTGKVRTLHLGIIGLPSGIYFRLLKIENRYYYG